MPRYHKMGKIPHKRHTVFKKESGGIFHEQLFGTIGFDGMSSLMYHYYPPTQVKEILGSKDVSPKIAEAKSIESGSFAGFNVPAKDDYIDRILGLELGADDYVTKPFNTRELIARINAVYRRFNKDKDSDEIVEYHDLKINTADRTLYKAGSEIPLTAKELELLKILMAKPGRVYTRENLF